VGVEIAIADLIGTDPRVMSGVPCFKVNGVVTGVPIFLALEHLADTGDFDKTLVAFLRDSRLQGLELIHIQAAIRVASVASRGYWEVWETILRPTMSN